MLLDSQLGLVIEQAIEHTRASRTVALMTFVLKGGVLTGDVSVESDAGIVPYFGFTPNLGPDSAFSRRIKAIQHQLIRLLLPFV
jgi:hypothetical protein